MDLITITSGKVQSVKDLREIVEVLRLALYADAPMLNGDVAVLMKIDRIIRSYGIEIGVDNLDTSFVKSNLSPFSGNSVIEKTIEYIIFLEKSGENNLADTTDYGVRNLTQILEEAPENVIEDKLGEINGELRAWFARRGKI